VKRSRGAEGLSVGSR